MSITHFFSRLRRPASQPGVILRHIAHTFLLCVITIAAILSFLYRPRFYVSGRPSGGGDDEIKRLCAHGDTPAREWNYIVVHHSATQGGSASSFERYHVHTHHWDSLGYHFVIGNGSQTEDGEIEVGPRWAEQQEGSHASGYNEEGIGICLVGNFENSQPTAGQKHSLHQLILHLAKEYDIPPRHVLGHNECRGAHTACPGKAMNMEKLRDWLRAKLNTRLSH